MELPSRNRGDELLKPGECLDIRRRLRRIAPRHNLATVVACAFDWRTRILPFYYSSVHMAPAGVRAVGAALADAGFGRTRIVLQQWNRRFRPSRMSLDGQVPDMFLVSSMQIHSAQCEALIRDACRIDPGRRPLIIAGGPKAIYEPWSLFGADRSGPWGADVAVTGEEYVLLNFLEVVLSVRADNEPLRSAFLRARDEGLLEGVPGLVYARTDRRGVVEELVDTGVQRLVGDLDELPHPVLGYQLLEPPSRRRTLAGQAMDPGAVRRHNWIVSLVLTSGCRFSCPYCPIPAYNQRQLRAKSGQRIADEMARLYEHYGIRQYFGTDDNFFSNKPRTLEIVETLGRAEINGAPLRRVARWATEVTVHDTLGMKEHLHAVRKAGIMALWLGVEDITATFVKKGQSVDKTAEAFRLLREQGILPVPMLMHHDGQPLYTRGTQYGLINQVRLLRKVGAIDVQILAMTPAPGSRSYEEAFTSGQVIQSAGGKKVEPYMMDGNYVVASRDARPWRSQLRVAMALTYFYNPLRLLVSLILPKSNRYLVDSGVQLTGMWGLSRTLPRMLGWALRLMTGKVKRQLRPPGTVLPLRRIEGNPSSHAAGRACASQLSQAPEAR